MKPPHKPEMLWMAAALGVLLAILLTAVLVQRQEQPAPENLPPAAAGSGMGFGKPSPGLSAARKAAADAAEAPAATVPAETGASSDTLAVHLVTTPPDAQVTIDIQRDKSCQSPCTLDLSPGVHTLVAKKPGYRSLLLNFQVSEDDQDVNVTLNPVTGSLVVETEPEGAAIIVDGALRDEITPATLALPAGRYKVRLTYPGYAPYDVDAIVLPEAVRQVSVALARTNSRQGVK